MRKLLILPLILIIMVVLVGCNNGIDDEDNNTGRENTFTLTIKTEGQGTVLPSEGTHKYDEGALVELVASSGDEWEFTTWKGNVRESQNKETSILMDKDKEVQAIFKPEQDILGSGSNNDPYIIFSLEGLKKIGVNDYSLDDYYELGYDIDASVTNHADYEDGKGWEPIPTFEGHFDGKGYSIQNLNINRPESNQVGFFGSTRKGSEIKNLYLTNADIIGNENVGILVGMNRTHITYGLAGADITNVFVSGKVRGSSNVGGLVGIHSSDYTNGYLEKSGANIEVQGEERVGGLVGYLFDGYVTRSYSKGKVNGGGHIGGLIGAIDKYYYEAILRNSYSTSKVEGTEIIGGLVGTMHNGDIITSYSAGNVNSEGTNSGGLLGYKFFGEITDSYYDKNTSGQNDTHKGIPKTTEEMMQKSTFIGFNFDYIWNIDENNSYPYF